MIRSLPTNDFWDARRVAITGHMGFKGSWLCMLLARLGAHSFGYGKDNRNPLLYPELKIANHKNWTGDINDTERVREWLQESQPEFLIHLAAQPIVFDSYDDPLSTFRDNILGTASILEAARNIGSLQAIIVVTSDKVYQNLNTGRVFLESDELGGSDPYSASKAAAEIVTQAMTKSYFTGEETANVVTVRAGNVIGGGDWAAHRLLPDAARSVAAGNPLVVRSPNSIRPWQHVLDPLAGYLLLCEKMSVKDGEMFQSWNFGPKPHDACTVADVMEMFVSTWGGDASWGIGNSSSNKTEAKLLSVDSSRATKYLNWKPVWKVNEAVRRTSLWYRGHLEGKGATMLMEEDLNAFLNSD